MSIENRIAKLEADLMFFDSFPEDFVPQRMSWEELYGRLIIAYDGYKALVESLGE